MAEAQGIVEHQFADLTQQKETSTLGIWTFLVSEVMLFGSLMMAYTVYRLAYPTAFTTASQHTDMLLGTLNTGVLLTSSLAMAFAVKAGREGHRQWVVFYLALTALLGTGFIGIKGYEYYKDWDEHLVPGPTFHLENPPSKESGLPLANQDMLNDVPPVAKPPSDSLSDLPSSLPDARTPELQPGALHHVELFFVLYFFLTGLHALHLSVGVLWASVVTLLAWRDRLPEGQPVEVLGLYWHFVDMVWVFLYPLLYLAGRHS
jgi:cytochrome c oxidase subunit 3